jgi:ribonucleoside-diphosphate reductase alpha chain
MDDIIDLELEKIDNILKKIESDPESEPLKARERNLWLNIKQKAMEGRRTGFGITAEGDMLAALGTRYGSDAAIDFSVEVHKMLTIEAYRSSVTMATERGAFPIYDAEREKNNPFILRLKEAAPELFNDMVKAGRRNIALLTIAPTGSVSILSQTTSGLEPVFAVTYKRRRKVNPSDKQARITFTDEIGDTWEEYNVFHSSPGLRRKVTTSMRSPGWMKRNSRTSSSNHLTTRPQPMISTGWLKFICRAQYRSGWTIPSASRLMFRTIPMKN